jgi:TonB-dependent SusC/RagA subfamily outer membrane receptor
MKKHTHFLIILLLSLFSLNLTAQERVVHGVVTTFDSIPLAEVNVKVKSTKQIVLTDSKGVFSVGCNTNDELKVSAKGFFSQKVKIEENIRYAAINLSLRPGEKSRNHAVGYGHVSDAGKLNAVSSLSNNDIDFSRYQNMQELIRGKFAGVQIINNEIVIRGIGIKGMSSSAGALVVINGVSRPVSAFWNMSPMQIKSINIIKDGSAAVYGINGANGVVVVETKQ